MIHGNDMLSSSDPQMDSLHRTLKAREHQIAELIHRLEVSESHNEALIAELQDREAADSETYESLANHVAELTTVEAEVAQSGHSSCIHLTR